MIGLNQDLLVILIIAGLIFGAKKLPEIGKGLGKGIKEFKSGLSGQDEEGAAPKAKEIPEDSINKKE
jgi:sec-independent protein translocase protein TatA